MTAVLALAIAWALLHLASFASNHVSPEGS
ncbi:Uncharacterised protein (plasmid) [Tsukamurella tyrosinosolvens]|uniref:Uncharacterized protein n=1 Tax=Tsukamurella tyrosinosolvens TaxID=57704 RepID=A0A1H4VIM7_TSUTY|nr:hypothetical protein SAMN04489793_3244 [Tsukamurella tyrosinosolvens]VEH90485.1 Uncharacterised protein [Tsukamurella tyrosinosolvens]